MNVPDWWSALLLSAAAWRTFQLLSADDILDRPRRWFLRLGEEWKREGDRVPQEYRAAWAAFLICPRCSGFWIAITWWLAWQLSERWTEIAATPLVLSAVVIALAKALSVDE